jgi:LTXXQ motif family protein
MRRIASLALLGVTLAGPPLAAQGPGPMRGPGGGPAAHGAGFLLAHTGELRLTDQQVVRLAAIARRTAERHEAMRAQMEANRPAPGAPGQPPRPEDAQRMRQQMEQAREQGDADLRDALAVLTPDQQALAWEMAARAAAPGGRGGPEGRGHRGRGRGGPDGPGGPGDYRGPDGPRERDNAPPREGAPRPGGGGGGGAEPDGALMQ